MYTSGIAALIAPYTSPSRWCSNIRRSPITLWSVTVRTFPDPSTIERMPINESVMLYQTLRSTLSKPKAELKRATKMGVVAKIREELLAVVRAMPLMKQS